MKFKISYVLIEKLKSNYKIKSGKSIKNKLCIIRIVKKMTLNLLKMGSKFRKIGSK